MQAWRISYSAHSPGTGRPCAALRLLCCSLLALCLTLTACASRQSVPPIDAAAPPGARKVVEKAYSQIGTRYRLGGNAPGKGFDCSGLVQWAYKESGISVPRITTDQARSGNSVARTAPLQVADILVFKTGTAPRGLHTGIYTGKGQFIHSPSKGQRVRTEQLDDEYWKKKYVGARRIIR